MERNTHLSGGITPSLQSVMLETGRNRRAGRFAKPAHMPIMAFAVGLNEIGAHPCERRDQFAGRGMFPECGIPLVCMQIIMQAQIKPASMPPPCRIVRHDYSCLSICAKPETKLFPEDTYRYAFVPGFS